MDKFSGEGALPFSFLSSLFQCCLTLQEKNFLYTFSGEIETDNLTVSNSEINIFNFIISKKGFHEIVMFNLLLNDKTLSTLT